MKIKFLPLIAVLFAATSIMTSCLDNDVEQITYTSETSITGFSLGTLNIDRIGKDQNGEDSAYVDTLNCSDYPFTINQLTREIENKDSLPYGTHIDKVITSITYDAGALAYRPKGADTDTLWTSTDSIDFSGDTYKMSTITPIEFKVYAYSGAIGQAYKVKVNVHQQIPDTIAWKKFDNSFSNRSLSKQKAVYANGKVYVFGENGGTHIEYSDVSNDNPTSWVAVTKNVPADIDTYSATACAEYIYFLAGTNKQLYKLDVNSNEITSVGTETFEMLIGGNDIKSELYAVKEGEKGRKSGIYKENTWTEDATPFTLFPAGKPFFSNTTTASYNSDITTTIALCNSTTANDTTALVFNRISSDNKWEERMQNLPLPNLENVTMIYYDGKLYAFGGGYGEIKPFSQFYCSTDNGLCWRPVTECMAFPAEFSELYTAHNKNYSCAVTPKLESETSRGNFIWIVWEDGSICRGRINRLGFTPKW